MKYAKERLEDAGAIVAFLALMIIWVWLLGKFALWIVTSWDVITRLPAAYYIALTVSLAVMLAGIWMIARIERGYHINKHDRD